MNEKKYDYSRFNDMIDRDAYNKQFADIEKNGGKKTYEEIPEGEYEVKLARLELGPNKKNAPMVKIAYIVLKGEYKGRDRHRMERRLLRLRRHAHRRAGGAGERGRIRTQAQQGFQGLQRPFHQP